MTAAPKWADLMPRIMSAVVLVLVCGVELYVGGWPFSVLVWVFAGLMTWELSRMFDAGNAVAIGLVAACSLGGTEIIKSMIGYNTALVPLLLAAVLVGVSQVKRDRVIYGLGAIWILFGCYTLLVLRHVAGLEWVLWLVCVVIVSDVMGYFAGRLLGGPKFWPKVSPKKTWSGTVAGWGGAAVIGWAFAGPTGAGLIMVPISIAAAFAGQMGDIAESAVKRHVGVKDSSSLIPGHGGVLDRFDAMLGASLFLFGLWIFGAMPGLS